MDKSKKGVAKLANGSTSDNSRANVRSDKRYACRGILMPERTAASVIYIYV